MNMDVFLFSLEYRGALIAVLFFSVLSLIKDGFPVLLSPLLFFFFPSHPSPQFSIFRHCYFLLSFPLFLLLILLLRFPFHRLEKNVNEIQSTLIAVMITLAGLVVAWRQGWPSSPAWF